MLLRYCFAVNKCRMAGAAMPFPWLSYDAISGEVCVVNYKGLQCLKGEKLLCKAQLWLKERPWYSVQVEHLLCLTAHLVVLLWWRKLLQMLSSLCASCTGKHWCQILCVKSWIKSCLLLSEFSTVSKPAPGGNTAFQDILSWNGSRIWTFLGGLAKDNCWGA